MTAPDTQPAAVDVERLTHRYGPRVALDGVSLRVAAGEAVALLGPNGSGKTTLFRVLSTLVPPQDGSARVAGHDVAAAPARVRAAIGVLFQSPSLDVQLTAAENLRHQGHLYGLRGRALAERVTELLARVGLSDRAAERVGRFSGGMRRRVEIAKGLLHRPRVLLLDEPSTGLDPAARLDVWRLLDDARRADGVTILMTTHLMDEAERCARVAILDAGRLIAFDAPPALREQVGGDVVTLTSSDPASVIDALRAKLSIDAATVDGRVVRFERSRAHELVPAIIEAAAGRIDSVSVGKPTLEDVFLRLTGRRFEEARDSA